MGKPDRVSSVTSKEESTQGTETSKYLKERKSTETPLVAASERGTGQTVSGNWSGVVDQDMVWQWLVEVSGKARHRG